MQTIDASLLLIGMRYHDVEMHSKAVFVIFNSDWLRQGIQNCFIDVCNTDSPDKEDCPDFSSLFDSDSLNQSGQESSSISIIDLANMGLLIR